MRTLLLFTFLAAPLMAQQPFTETDCLALFNEATLRPQIESETSARDSSEQKGSTLGGSTVGPITTTAVALVAGEAEGRGVISYTRRGTAHDFALKASTPFTKTTGEGVFATQDSLTGDLVVTGGWTWRGWDLEIADYGRTLCGKCREDGVSLLNCHGTVLAADRATDLLFGTVAAKVFGADASVGRRKREYFTAAGVVEDESRIGSAASVYGGLIFQQWSGYLRLTVKEDYKENGVAQNCQPVGTGLEKCKSLPFEEAKRMDSFLVATEARYFLTDIALAPSVAYDFEGEDTTIQLPVFLLRDDAEAFTGGIRLGWTTRDDVGFSAAIFVTKPFKP